jgi:hypothetical protein
MTTPPVQVERRVGQRFSYLLPVSFRETSTGVEGRGFTQDISSRGVFLFTDTPLREGGEVELTLNMPSEITLGENMRVRCRGRILRVTKPAATQTGAESAATETKLGVAVRLEGYEYLAEPSESSPAHQRVSALHSHHEEDAPLPVLRRPAFS